MLLASDTTNKHGQCHQHLCTSRRKSHGGGFWNEEEAANSLRASTLVNKHGRAFLCRFQNANFRPTKTANKQFIKSLSVRRNVATGHLTSQLAPWQETQPFRRIFSHARNARGNMIIMEGSSNVPEKMRHSKISDFNTKREYSVNKW